VLFQMFKLFQLYAQDPQEHAGMRHQVLHQAGAMLWQVGYQMLLCASRNRF